MAHSTSARVLAVSGALLPTLTAADGGVTIAARWGAAPLAPDAAMPAIRAEVEGALEAAYELAELAIAARAAAERWPLETLRLLLYRPEANRLELFAGLRLRRPRCESRRH